METWDGAEDFRDWLQNAVSWVSCVDFTMITAEEIKSALWRALPTEKRRFADILKPGSMSFTHDTLKEYSRHMLDTFKPPRYTEVWKQKYNARVHKVGEPVECYLLDKMRLFRASHDPYDFKRFLETGLQSICHPKLQQHIISQKYRTYKSMMRDISDISSKWRSLHYSGQDSTGTLAGIMEPPLMRDSHKAWLNRTGQHKMEVNAVENTVEQGIAEPWMLQPGKVNAVGNCYNYQQPGHIKSQCTKGKMPTPTSTPAANGARTVSATAKCFKCERIGHFARDC